MDRMEAGPGAEPTAAIRDDVAALVTRWPDITDPAGEDSPWADGPLINNADGHAIYFRCVLLGPPGRVRSVWVINSDLMASWMHKRMCPAIEVTGHIRLEIKPVY